MSMATVVWAPPTCRGRWICHLLGVGCIVFYVAHPMCNEPTQAGLLCAFRLQQGVALFVMCFSLSPWSTQLARTLQGHSSWFEFEGTTSSSVARERDTTHLWYLVS